MGRAGALTGTSGAENPAKGEGVSMKKEIVMTVKKAVKVKKGKKTAVKKGTVYSCAGCGAVLIIDEAGSCDFVDCIICACGATLKPKK